MKNLFYFLGFLFIIQSCTKSDETLKKDSESGFSTVGKLKSAYIPSTYRLVWEDQFNGTAIDTNNWVVASLRDPITGDLVPGAAGDHLLNSYYCGYITEEDSYIQNGSLVLRNQKRSYQGTSPSGNYNYTSSWVMSMHRVFLNKGYIEVRAKFPSGDKVWPAIWLIAEDLTWGPEWDLFEYFGYKSDVGYDNMGMHLCYDTWPNEKWSSAWLKNFDKNYDCETWHVYGFEWTSTYAKWYIDGVLMRTLNASSISNWPNENMYLVLNNGQRTSSPDATTSWPNTLEIDYIQIYQNQNLLTNGDLETGNLSPWTKYGSASVAASNQYQGNYCASISADNSGVEYLVSGLSPNTSYTFKGYVKTSGTSQKANLSVKDFGSTQIYTAIGNTSYTLVSIPFTTGASNTSAKVCFYRYANGSGSAYGDAFELVKN